MNTDGCRSLGNGEFYETVSQEKIQLLRRDNKAVVLFNYCGVAESGGKICGNTSPSLKEMASRVIGAVWGSCFGYHYFTTRESLLIQTGSMISFMQKQLGYEASKMFVLGHSIGGALAVQSAVHFPKIHVCADRTFAHLSDVAQFHVVGWACDPAIAHVWYAKLARNAMWFALEYIVGWELDTFTHWKHLAAGQDRRLVIAFHPQDK